MSDAELLELYALYNDSFTSIIAQVITLIFACIVASCLTAKQSKRVPILPCVKSFYRCYNRRYPGCTRYVRKNPKSSGRDH